MFAGTLHCPRCGSTAQRAEATELAVRSCPRCRVDMASITLGLTTLRECSQCSGLWVDVPTFEQISADRERQAAVLGAVSTATSAKGPTQNGATYIPCPECKQLMNRMNFARCSGVIVDLCKQHGIWFDRDELRLVVEFIMGGGLEKSRTREKEDLADERRRLQQERTALDAERARMSIGGYDRRRDTGLIATDIFTALLG
jgi:Zn-finger nucleic acid-binding protein